MNGSTDWRKAHDLRLGGCGDVLKGTLPLNEVSCIEGDGDIGRSVFGQICAGNDKPPAPSRPP